jgi:hypothetical protein
MTGRLLLELDLLINLKRRTFWPQQSTIGARLTRKIARCIHG